MTSITCPNCKASYSVDRGMLAARRSVRCAKCHAVWQHQAAEPEILPPDNSMERRMVHSQTALALAHGGPAGISQFGRTGNSGPPAFAAGAAARARLAADQAITDVYQPTRPRLRRRLETLTLAIAATLMVAGLAYRAEIVRAAPSTGGLYSLIGLPVNLRGLSFETVVPRRRVEDGVPVLIIEGTISNLRAEATPVPALRFAVRGASGAQLYSWTVEPSAPSLEAGDSMPFRTRLAAPPEGAEEVMVRFADPAPHRTRIGGGA